MRLIDADACWDRILNGCCYSTEAAIMGIPTIDPVHAANAYYCKECQYYEPFRDYPDCSKILTYGYCYYWKYEEGKSPNEVDENDFCSKGRKDCNK